MNTTLRIYGPGLVLLLWALVVATIGLSRFAAAIALASMAGAIKVQVDEARRQHRDRRRLRSVR